MVQCKLLESGIRSNIYMGIFKKSGTAKSSISKRVFHYNIYIYKPSIFGGTPTFGKKLPHVKNYVVPGLSQFWGVAIHCAQRRGVGLKHATLALVPSNRGDNHEAMLAVQTKTLFLPKMRHLKMGMLAM